MGFAMIKPLMNGRNWMSLIKPKKKLKKQKNFHYVIVVRIRSSMGNYHINRQLVIDGDKMDAVMIVASSFVILYKVNVHALDLLNFLYMDKITINNVSLIALNIYMIYILMIKLNTKAQSVQNMIFLNIFIISQTIFI